MLGSQAMLAPSKQHGPRRRRKAQPKSAVQGFGSPGRAGGGVGRPRIAQRFAVCPRQTPRTRREDWDSNPGTGRPVNGFQDRRLRPLGHPPGGMLLRDRASASVTPYEGRTPLCTLAGMDDRVPPAHDPADFGLEEGLHRALVEEIAGDPVRGLPRPSPSIPVREPAGHRGDRLQPRGVDARRPPSGPGRSTPTTARAFGRGGSDRSTRGRPSARSTASSAATGGSSG